MTGDTESLAKITERLLRIEAQARMIGEVVTYLSENEIDQEDYKDLVPMVQKHMHDVEQLLARVQEMSVAHGEP